KKYLRPGPARREVCADANRPPPCGEDDGRRSRDGNDRGHRHNHARAPCRRAGQGRELLERGENEGEVGTDAGGAVRPMRGGPAWANTLATVPLCTCNCRAMVRGRDRSTW